MSPKGRQPVVDRAENGSAAVAECEFVLARRAVCGAGKVGAVLVGSERPRS